MSALRQPWLTIIHISKKFLHHLGSTSSGIFTYEYKWNTDPRKKHFSPFYCSWKPYISWCTIIQIDFQKLWSRLQYTPGPIIPSSTSSCIDACLYPSWHTIHKFIKALLAQIAPLPLHVKVPELVEPRWCEIFFWCVYFKYYSMLDLNVLMTLYFFFYFKLLQSKFFQDRARTYLFFLKKNDIIIEHFVYIIDYVTGRIFTSVYRLEGYISWERVWKTKFQAYIFLSTCINLRVFYLFLSMFTWFWKFIGFFSEGILFMF